MTEITIKSIHIQHHEVLVSTNRTAMEHTCPIHGLTVVADRQDGGRGRMGRDFYSYEGGLYMSVVLEPERIRIAPHLITPAAAIAVFEVLGKNGATGLSVKWVNDILKDGKKVCGILTEARTAEEGLSRIVVGIGINLAAHKDFPSALQSKAESLDFGGDKLELAADITKTLLAYLTTSPSRIAAEYMKHLAFLGKTAEVTDYAAQNARITGTVLGVTEDCFLRLRLQDGSERVLSSGEIL